MYCPETRITMLREYAAAGGTRRLVHLLSGGAKQNTVVVALLIETIPLLDTDGCLQKTGMGVPFADDSYVFFTSDSLNENARFCIAFADFSQLCRVSANHHRGEHALVLE